MCLHALRHADLLADRRVTRWRRTDFTGYHLTRVQANAQSQHETVAKLNLSGQALCLPLDIQRDQTRELRDPPTLSARQTPP